MQFSSETFISTSSSSSSSSTSFALPAFVNALSFVLCYVLRFRLQCAGQVLVCVCFLFEKKASSVSFFFSACRCVRKRVLAVLFLEPSSRAHLFLRRPILKQWPSKFVSEIEIFTTKKKKNIITNNLEVILNSDQHQECFTSLLLNKRLFFFYFFFILGLFHIFLSQVIN